MLVDIQARQRTNVNLKLILIRNGFSGKRIKAVNSFNDQNVVLIHTKLTAIIFSLANLEIKFRKLHFLAIEQICQILIEQIQIDSFDDIKVIIAIDVYRGFLSIDKPVIHGENVRMHAE